MIKRIVYAGIIMINAKHQTYVNFALNISKIRDVCKVASNLNNLMPHLNFENTKYLYLDSYKPYIWLLSILSPLPQLHKKKLGPDINWPSLKGTPKKLLQNLWN